MTTRQERSARATRRATTQAEQVIAKAVQRVKCRQCGARGERVDGVSKIEHEATCPRAVAKVPQQRRPQTDAKATATRPPTAGTDDAGSSSSVDLAAECKRLRDEEGEAWWRIGYRLGLPGSADNVRAGKSGAAAARRLYASANGGQRAERGASTVRRQRRASEPKHAGNSGSKVDRKLDLIANGHVIPRDTTDEEVVAMVRGRTVEWGINLKRLCAGKGEDYWVNQEARVSPNLDSVIIDEEPDTYGGRVLRFREYLGLDKEGQVMLGNTRTIRVDAIHTVR